MAGNFLQKFPPATLERVQRTGVDRLGSGSVRRALAQDDRLALALALQTHQTIESMLMANNQTAYERAEKLRQQATELKAQAEKLRLQSRELTKDASRRCADRRSWQSDGLQIG